MTIKRLLQVISVTGLVVAGAEFFYWAFLLSSSSGEDWASWRKIDTIWTVIPVSLIASVVAGIASSRVQPRSQKSARAGLTLAIVAVLVAAGILWILLNLGIS